MSTLYLLVAGSRDFANESNGHFVGKDFMSCYDIVDTLIKGRLMASGCDDACVIEGTARGVDRIAGRVARNSDYGLKEMPADWSKGKAAGYIRNSQMHEFLSRHEHREVLLIWDGVSKGTAHNFKLARQNNTPLVCYLYREQRFMSPEEIKQYYE